MKRSRTNRLKTVDPKIRHKALYKMKLAAKIDDLRIEKGWNKGAFAGEMNREPSVITKWLSGTHNFTADTLSEIAFVFGLEEIQVFEKKVVKEYSVTILQKTMNPVNWSALQSRTLKSKRTLYRYSQINSNDRSLKTRNAIS